MKNSIIVGLLLLLVSCGGSVMDVKTGMTENEVKELLGEPNQTSSKSNSYTLNGEETGTSEATWKYNGKGTVKFQDGKVVSIEK